MFRTYDVYSQRLPRRYGLKCLLQNGNDARFIQTQQPFFSLFALKKKTKNKKTNIECYTIPSNPESPLNWRQSEDEFQVVGVMVFGNRC